MSKIVKFKFRDGIKEIKVFDTVIVVNSDARYNEPSKKTIQKIGNKLIHLEFGEKFCIEDGCYAGEYASYSIYSSLDGYKYIVEQEEIISKIKNLFTYGYSKTYNNKKLKEILEYLSNGEQNNE